MNGKGEWLRWLAALALGSVVGYFTDKGDMQERVAILETQTQTLLEFRAEIRDELKDIKSDVRVLVERSYVR